ncbi:Holliday junction branch migration protein RuvA [Alkaliphilus peptidifermentans]|uniref:Holliday junction branch migration complex subunit RuvA n=1 Tax=Alkaliphilus peptidifermentans DSM 18978 TaxID=1120976 RepID=A0A1G5L5B6_9FIRM|nr:Holliday junction branch migration protein RuvA [Alkaliphilus peptidifermentans]SCZ07389.1 Holliday junction DNA helicase subunit RuvA [Alkaliphilus peptidifermentans DSM 18978]
MFEYIKGKITEIFVDKIIIEVNGIGYRINSSMNSTTEICVGEDTTIYTHLVVKEDEMSLYGFTTRKELNIFRQLISVSKIGPKVASGILSTYTPDRLGGYIKTNDIASIAKAPGVGKKTAERLVLELKDKVEVPDIEFANIASNVGVRIESNEVLEALLSLGYNRNEAEGAYKAVYQEGLTTEAMIRKALLWLGR